MPTQYDVAFGRLAIGQGLLHPDTVRQAYRQLGPNQSLSGALVQAGFLQVAQAQNLDRLLNEQIQSSLSGEVNTAASGVFYAPPAANAPAPNQPANPDAEGTMVLDASSVQGILGMNVPGQPKPGAPTPPPTNDAEGTMILDAPPPGVVRTMRYPQQGPPDPQTLRFPPNSVPNPPDMGTIQLPPGAPGAWNSGASQGPPPDAGTIQLPPGASGQFQANQLQPQQFPGQQSPGLGPPDAGTIQLPPGASGQFQANQLQSQPFPGQQFPGQPPHGGPPPGYPHPNQPGGVRPTGPARGLHNSLDMSSVGGQRPASSGEMPRAGSSSGQHPHARPMGHASGEHSTFGGDGELPAIGQHVGNYVIQAVLGEGGMGAVYRAAGPDGQQYALKVMLPGADLTGKAVIRFQREAEAMAKVDDHVGVVRVRDFGHHDGNCPFAVQDLVIGRDLSERLEQDGPLPLDDALRYMEGVSQAIQHCHDRHVLHRDLKPGNILVRAEDDQPFVTDFGLALADKDGERLTETGEVLGTPAYMPPEQADGDKSQIDGRSDVYSLGATLFALVTGRPPFEGPNVTAILTKLFTELPPQPHLLRDGLPPDVSAICLKAMAKETSKRYATAREFADDLGRLRRREPIHARIPSRSEVFRFRLKRRDPRALFLVGLLVLALLTPPGAFGIYLLTREPNYVLQARETLSARFSQDLPAALQGPPAPTPFTSPDDSPLLVQRALAAELVRAWASANGEENLDDLGDPLEHLAAWADLEPLPPWGGPLDDARPQIALLLRRLRVAAGAIPPPDAARLRGDGPIDPVFPADDPESRLLSALVWVQWAHPFETDRTDQLPSVRALDRARQTFAELAPESDVAAHFARAFDALETETQTFFSTKFEEGIADGGLVERLNRSQYETWLQARDLYDTRLMPAAYTLFREAKRTELQRRLLAFQDTVRALRDSDPDNYLELSLERLGDMTRSGTEFHKLVNDKDLWPPVDLDELPDLAEPLRQALTLLGDANASDQVGGFRLGETVLDLVLAVESFELEEIPDDLRATLYNYASVGLISYMQGGQAPPKELLDFYFRLGRIPVSTLFAPAIKQHLDAGLFQRYAREDDSGTLHLLWAEAILLAHDMDDDVEESRECARILVRALSSHFAADEDRLLLLDPFRIDPPSKPLTHPLPQAWIPHARWRLCQVLHHLAKRNARQLNVEIEAWCLNHVTREHFERIHRELYDLLRVPPSDFSTRETWLRVRNDFLEAASLKILPLANTPASRADYLQEVYKLLVPESLEVGHEVFLLSYNRTGQEVDIHQSTQEGLYINLFKRGLREMVRSLAILLSNDPNQLERAIDLIVQEQAWLASSAGMVSPKWRLTEVELRHTRAVRLRAEGSTDAFDDLITLLEDSLRLFESAVLVLEDDRGGRLNEARAQLAACLLERNATGDRERAQRLLDDTRAQHGNDRELGVGHTWWGPVLRALEGE